MAANPVHPRGSVLGGMGHLRHGPRPAAPAGALQQEPEDVGAAAALGQLSVLRGE